MNKNKFRGVSHITNKWIYGDCIHITEKDIAIVYDSYGNRQTIYTESLGQFTGVLDCDGVEIYEGDLVALPIVHIENNGEEHKTFSDSDYISTIVYVNGCYMLDNRPVSLHFFCEDNNCVCKDLKVVGSKFLERK